MRGVARPRNSHPRRLVLGRSTVLALVAFGFLSVIVLAKSARANAVVCVNLLLKVELDPDPRSIRATIFDTLVVDFHLLLSTRVNQLMFETFLKKEISPYDFTVNKQISEEAEARREKIHLLRSPETRLTYAEDAAIVWQKILEDFAFDSRSAAFRQYSPKIPKERFDDLEMILRTIDGNGGLRRQVLSILEEELVTIDQWSQKTYCGTFIEASVRELEVARIQKAHGEFVLPTLISALKATGDVEPLELDLSKIASAFRATVDPTALSTYAGTLAYDRDLLVNFQKFSTGISTLRDQFIAYPNWGAVYDAGAVWLKHEMKTLSAKPKSEFLNSVLHALSFLDAHVRTVLRAREVLSLGEANAIARIAEVERTIAEESAHPGRITSLHAGGLSRSLAQLKHLLAEIQAVEKTLAGWSERTDEANRLLRALHSETAAGPMTIGDPKAFNAKMAEIRKTLDLDPAFDNRLKGKWWRAW